MKSLYFITHPNVVISRDVTAVYCSTEQKAIAGAEILAGHLGLPFHQVDQLGENDRSATGFLPRDEFERMADAFFASPEESIRGWERAADAQSRIVGAVNRIDKEDKTKRRRQLLSIHAFATRRAFLVARH